MINSIIRKNIMTNLRSSVVIFILAAFLSFAIVALHPQYFLPENYLPLIIIATGQHRADSTTGASVVDVLMITHNENPIDLTSLDLYGTGFEHHTGYYEGAIFALGHVQPASLELMLPPGQINIVFYSHLWGGIVRVETLDKSSEINLYSQTVIQVSHYININNVATNNYLLIVLLYALLVCLLLALKILIRATRDNMQLRVVAFALSIVLTSSLVLSMNPIPSIFPERDLLAAVLEAQRKIDMNLSFSQSNHFQTDGFFVEITTSNPDARIFFTTDGSTPTLNSTEYVSAIYFELKPEVYAVVLRAIAVYGDAITAPLTKTYFIGQNVHERFGTLVFSLSINPEYLFDHDIGIMVEGAIREEWVRLHNMYDTFSPTNYFMRGREWERPVYVEVFNYCGGRMMTQAAGARIHGNTSRAYNIKSFRLIARRVYSPEAARFNFDFFPDMYGSGGVPFSRSNTLILRNGGNTMNQCLLRNELGFYLARNAGFQVVSPVRPVAVFLNGEYYAFMWLQVRIDEHFLMDMFDAPTRDFDVVNGYPVPISHPLRTLPDERILADLAYKNEFAFKDLLNDYIFAELNEVVDVENFLLYSAIQIFFNNFDWPGIGFGGINLRRWRYTGEQTSYLAPELDGRWRFAIFDMDAIFGLGGSMLNAELRAFQQVLEGTGGEHQQSKLLQNILTRPDMADLFVMMICDIAANVVNSQKIREAYLKMTQYGTINEMRHSVRQRGRNMIPVFRGHINIINFASDFHMYIFESLTSYFGFSPEMFTVNISGGKAIIGTQQGISSKYFNHLVVPVSPVLPPFTEFDHWVLNGRRMYEPNVTVSFYDTVYNEVNLVLVTRPFVPTLVIASTYVTDRGNGAILMNPSSKIVSTRGLFLSNNPNNLQLWSLPEAVVLPGGVFELGGRRTADASHIFRVQMNFDIRESSKLFLSDETGLILDTFVLRPGQPPRDIEDVLNHIRLYL